MSYRYDALLSPIRIGDAVIKNRTMYPNASPHFLQGPETYPADSFMTFMGGLARNGAAIITLAEWSNPNQRSAPVEDAKRMQNFDYTDPGTYNYFTQMADDVHFYGSKLLVNTDMLKELGVEVNGYADLLQPELVGKIASADPASSSSAFCQLTNMLLAMGGYEDDAAWQYVQDLFVGQQVAITSGSSAVYKGVYNGEYAVGLTYEDPCVTLIKDGATNIQVVYPVEGTVFLPAQIGIVKNAKNVENAKAFVDFMLSEDAQRFLAENTTSRNVREVEYKNDVMTPLADIKLIYEDSDYVIAHTSELKEKVQDIMMDM